MEFEGQLINRNNRAKEQTLYKVIAEKDAEIAALKAELRSLTGQALVIAVERDDIREEFRALKSKEYRRTKKRKKANEAS
jgi:peptidoglycan hydrolase CwlO-like protein